MFSTDGRANGKFRLALLGWQLGETAGFFPDKSMVRVLFKNQSRFTLKITFESEADYLPLLPTACRNRSILRPKAPLPARTQAEAGAYIHRNDCRRLRTAA